jgi:LSD1 subclass zinc finger protein
MTLTIECPSCRRQLRLPPDLLGRSVRCPTCSTTFTAEDPAATSEAVPLAAEAATPASSARDRAGDAEERASPPRRRRRDEDDEDERPWDRGPTVRRDCEPHRGGMVLALGIVGIVVPLLGGPCAIIAWVMGQRDRVKIHDRVMDPAGEGLTLAGWICGIIGTVLQALYYLGCFLYIAAIVAMFSAFSSMRPPAKFTVRALPTRVAPAPAPAPPRPRNGR